MRRKGWIPLIAALLAALAVAGCGANDGSGGGDGSGSAAQGPVHVHGLGINPKDRSLFIATHTGLFRVGADETKATRVGRGTQDTMGFTVLGPDRFLGSGHPGELENKPPNLGLIESDNAGRSWRSVSLLGQADFHVLRAVRGRIYGFDASNGRLLISVTRGRDWKEVSPPGPLLDLAVDPQSPSRVTASTDRGLFASSDGGRSWRPLPRSEPSLLAWPADDRLYRVNAAGKVSISPDRGESWRAKGSIGGQPAALLARGARTVYAALPDGTIVMSEDEGRSWSVRARP